MSILDKLFDVYKEIEIIYKKLYKMESSGYKNLDVFVNSVDILKIKLSKEKRLFASFVESKEYEKIRDDLNNYNGNDEFYIRMRDHIILYDKKSLVEDEKDTDDDYYEFVEIVAKIYDICSKNLFVLYVYFLDSTKDKLMVESLKNRLLKIKYYNSLVKHNLELALVENNFNVKDDIYIDTNLRIDFMNVDEEMSEEIILDSYMTTINNVIENLMCNIIEEDTNYENKLAASINYQCLLKAVMALMSEYEYNLLYDKIIERIKELLNDDNKNIVEDIMDIINNRIEYRSKVRKLSLKPLKN